MRRLLHNIVLVLFVGSVTMLFASGLSQKIDVTEKARAVFARLAGEWICTAMPKGRKEEEFESRNLLYTLSRTGNQLLAEEDVTDRFANSTRIYSIDAKRDLLRELDMTENAQNVPETKPISKPQIVRTRFGKFEASGDVLWLTYMMDPLHVWHMVDDNTIQDMPLGHKSPDDWVNYRPPIRLIRRAYQPQSDTAQEPQGELKEEKRILAGLAGDWTEQEARNDGTSFAGSKKILFRSSRFQRRFLGEYPDNSGITYIWGVIPVRNNAFRGFFWWQLIETDDPARPDLIGMIGSINPTEDAVLWKKQGQPVELWHFPDTNTVLRLTPCKDDPFDVKKGVLQSRWVREKKTEPGKKP